MTAAHPILTVTTDSVFAGADVCQEARLILPDGVPRPNFDDDAWDLTQVVGLPRQLALQHRRFGFAAIDDIRWRLVAKELVLALLAPAPPGGRQSASRLSGTASREHLPRSPGRTDPPDAMAAQRRRRQISPP